MTGEENVRSGGLLASLRAASATIIEIVLTRIELVAAEFDEEKARLVRALWLAIAGAFCLSLGVLLTVLFLVVVFWDSHRLLVLGVLAAAFLAAGLGAVLALRKGLSERGRLFAQTLDELKRDRELLRP